MSEEKFHKLIYDLAKSCDVDEFVERLTRVKYPNSNSYVQVEHALYFYEKYKKLNVDIAMDENFTRNAYNKNSEIFHDVNDYKTKNKKK